MHEKEEKGSFILDLRREIVFMQTRSDMNFFHESVIKMIKKHHSGEFFLVFLKTLPCFSVDESDFLRYNFLKDKNIYFLSA